MSLLSCPECGGLLSTEARDCPHCGYPLRKGGIGSVFSAIAQIPCFVAGLILIFIALFFGLVLLDVYYFHGLIPRLFGIEGHVTTY